MNVQVHTENKTMRKPEPKKLWLSQLFKIPLLLLFPAAYLLEWLYQKKLSFRNFYDALYPAYSRAVNRAFSFYPYSVAEILFFILIAGVIAYLIFMIVRLIRRPHKALRAVTCLLTLLSVFSALYFLFIFSFGLQYQRGSVADEMGLTIQNRSKDELSALCISLVEDAAELREQLPEDEQGVFTYEETLPALFRQIPAAYARLGEKYPTFSMAYQAPKGVKLLSWWMCQTQIAGIFIPHTMEPSVNIDQHPLLLASAACHEQAHLYGFAREDEANFIAYLSCMNSDNPEIRYSGTMLALVESMNQLYHADMDSFLEIRRTYSEGMDRDIHAYDLFWEKYDTKVAEVSNQVNDRYLISRGQEDGVKSYGRMVDLLLAYRERGCID